MNAFLLEAWLTLLARDGFAVLERVWPDRNGAYRDARWCEESEEDRRLWARIAVEPGWTIGTRP